MRKWLLGAILALVLLPATAFAAGGKLEVRIPESVPASGETFQVTVNMTENPGFHALQFTLTWEPKDMVCEDVSIESLPDSALSAFNLSDPDGAVVGIASIDEITSTGALAVFTFRGRPDLKNVRWGLADVIFSDAENHSIPLEVVGAELVTPTEPIDGKSSGTESAGGGHSSGGGQSSGGGSKSSVTKPPGGVKTPGTQFPDDGETLGTQSSDGGDTLAPSTETEPPPFSDIAGTWAESYIRQGFRLNLFGGYSDGTFRPDNVLTRAQFVTVLWNLTGRPAPKTPSPFEDMENQIPAFQDAVSWACERGIVNGVTPVSFAPGAPLTRQAAMKILFGYDGGKSGQEQFLTDIYDESFTDSGFISSWGKEGMYWGVYNGIIKGTTTTTLNPAGRITRAQMAAIMVRYVDGSQDAVPSL